jgi:glutamate racemase
VVLACTHYPLLIARLEQIAPWPVNFIDPAPAIARRVGHLLEASAAAAAKGSARAIFTSGRAPAAILARFGMSASQFASVSAP